VGGAPEGGSYIVGLAGWDPGMVGNLLSLGDPSGAEFCDMPGEPCPVSCPG
jgi:hypothetical protein